MKTLLRSVILVSASDSQKEADDNIGHLLTSGLNFEEEEAQKIWEIVKSFYLSHNHVPNILSVRSQLDRVRARGAIDYLEQVLVSERMLTRGDFVSHLVTIAEDRKVVKFLELSRKASEIAAQGITLQEKGKPAVSLQGAPDAIKYLVENSADIMIPTLGSKTSGNAMKDGARELSRYSRVKNDPSFGVGVYCGIEQIDTATRGAQRKKLWVHGAFPGHLKTAYALQWAYNAAIYYGRSSHYYALEMAYEEELLPILYAMHSAHEDFAEVRASLGIEGLGLDIVKINYAELSPNEEEFYEKFVIPDFNREATVAHENPWSLNPKDYGSINIVSEDPDRRYSVMDVKAISEMAYHQDPFDVIYVDYAELLKPIGRYTNRTDGSNEIIRDLKKLATGFNKGAGIAVVALWQLNREGFAQAEKNDGIYSLRAFTYANEVEKSADIVTTSWYGDDVKSVRRAYFQCLKSRHGKPYDRIAVRVEPEVKRILTDRTSIDEVQHEIEVRKGEAEDLSENSRYFGGQPDIEAPGDET